MIKKAKIRHAVEILRELVKNFHEDPSKKKNLLEDETEGSLFLQISLKKIPDTKNVKMIQVPLPNSMRVCSTACLITGDLDKKNHKAEIEPDVLHYKELLNNCGVTGISEVVTLRQLRTDYKPYEAKQMLLAAYDMFLADKKIAGVLPRVLGKHFFTKRKFPIQIDLKSQDLKTDIEKALSKSVLFLTGHGNSCTLEIACLDMDDSKIIENIASAANTLSEKLPGSWDNVMGVYLKTAKSKAIPIYMSYDGVNDIKLEVKKGMDITEDDLSTLPNASVRVYSDGRVECKRTPQNDDSDEWEDDISGSEEEELPNAKRKRKRFDKPKKSLLPECDQLNDEPVKVEIAENDSLQKDSQEEAKKLKRPKMQNSVIKQELPSNDSEESEASKSPIQTKKVKKSKKKITSMKSVDISPIDSEDSQAVKLSVKTKKMKKVKKETTNVKPVEIPPNDSEDFEAVETKKNKKSRKPITSVEHTELPPNKSEDLQVIKSPVKTKKLKKSKQQTTNLEHVEQPSHDFEDFETVKSPVKTKKNKKSKKEITSVPQHSECLSNKSENLQVVKSPVETKKMKKPKKQTTNLEHAEQLSLDFEDAPVVKSSEETKKTKKPKKQVANMKQIELPNDTEDKPCNQKKSTKRKRVDSVSTLVEPQKEKYEFESPIQVLKKKRMEGNLKKYLSIKEARKNNKKDNRTKINTYFMNC